MLRSLEDDRRANKLAVATSEVVSAATVFVVLRSSYGRWKSAAASAAAASATSDAAASAHPSSLFKATSASTAFTGSAHAAKPISWVSSIGGRLGGAAQSSAAAQAPPADGGGATTRWTRFLRFNAPPLVDAAAAAAPEGPPPSWLTCVRALPVRTHMRYLAVAYVVSAAAGGLATVATRLSFPATKKSA
jgi:hypothetical protein